MRYTFLFIAVCFGLVSYAQNMKDNQPKTFKIPPMAGEKDSMTMKQYYFVMLIKGKDRDKITDKATIDKFRKGIWQTWDNWQKKENYWLRALSVMIVIGADCLY